MKHNRAMLDIYLDLSTEGLVEELEHFYPCQHCGQLVDMRLLDDVNYHKGPDHEPLSDHVV